MPAANKDTIYIDVEDEITAVIEKVVSAKHKIVALVLPKRATVFQSPVNMKLLKKAAKSANKSLVLITSDKGILAIAAASSLHVAKSLTTKPTIPKLDTETGSTEERVDLSDAAVAAVAVAGLADQDGDEAIEIDNTDETSEKSEGEEKSTNKKLLKIPDFSSFRFKVGAGIGAIVLLIVMWVFGFVILPKATVTINTDTSTTSINSKAMLRAGQSELDLESSVIPAERVQTEKIDSLKVPATGQKNVGNKATGTMNLTNCIKSDGNQVVPAGTRFSAGSVTFESTEQAILPESTFNASGQCKSKDVGDDKTVGVIALEPGEQFNVSAQSYSSAISGIVASGSNMSGGISEIIKVISAEDVQKAEQQLKGASKSAAQTELKAQLTGNDKMPVEETLTEGVPTTTVVPAVGEEADEVEVTVTITYALQGISEQDLSEYLDNEAKKSMGEQEKNIKDNGIDGVNFQVTARPNEADTEVTIQTVATLGPDIDETALRQDIAGKKRGDIEKQIESIEGVRSVSVEYSPAWITTTPKSAEKITIIFNETDEQ